MSKLRLNAVRPCSTSLLAPLSSLYLRHFQTACLLFNPPLPGRVGTALEPSQPKNVCVPPLNVVSLINLPPLSQLPQSFSFKGLRQLFLWSPHMSLNPLLFCVPGFCETINYLTHAVFQRHVSIWEAQLRNSNSYYLFP
jgi:hypothetical protein